MATKTKTQKIEDIERAAWYARLAFGIYQEKLTKPVAKPEKPESSFYVMP